MKTFKDDSYMQKEKPFHQENSLKPCYATFEKSDLSRMVLSPIP